MYINKRKRRRKFINELVKTGQIMIKNGKKRMESNTNIKVIAEHKAATVAGRLLTPRESIGRWLSCKYM